MWLMESMLHLGPRILSHPSSLLFKLGCPKQSVILDRFQMFLASLAVSRGAILLIADKD